MWGDDGKSGRGSASKAHQAYCDETWQDLDRQLLFGITSVLQLEPALEEGLDLLRKQWCAESSVHGGNATGIGAT